MCIPQVRIADPAFNAVQAVSLLEEETEGEGSRHSAATAYGPSASICTHGLPASGA
jgi:hypothetical protein